MYVVGVLRQLGAPLKGNYMTGALTNMQQRPYRPPNVAGWEGGMSWLNTNTVQGRFDAVVRAQFLTYSNNANSYPRPALVEVDVAPARRAAALVDRAHASIGRPWLSDGTRAALLAYATAAPTGDRRPAPAALLHRAGPDARRPRRTGDVTCAASNARRSSSPACSDERPSQTLAVPHAALDGFPAGRSPADLTRRRLLQFGVAGLASVYGPKALELGVGLGVRRGGGGAPDQNCLVLLYLAGGNDGLNTIVPNDPDDYAAYVDARDGDPPAARAPTRAVASARRRWPARAARPAGVLERDGLDGGGGDNGDRASGSTRCSATAPAAPGRTSR